MGNSLIDNLIQAHGTNNPARIAAEHSIRVLYEDLGKNTWGYYSCIKRIPIIHINSSLSEFFWPFTLAHELGHHFLHQGVNTPFLRGNTLLSVDKIEREANHFAMRLLVGGSHPYQDETTSQFLLRCGIPKQLHMFF